MSKRIDLTGQRFGKLTVLEHIKNRGWKCRCDCGREIVCLSQNLRKGASGSCGHAGCKLNRRTTVDIPTEDELSLLHEIKGVHYCHSINRFGATIGGSSTIGRFCTMQDAIEARKLAEFDLLKDKILNLIKEFPDYNYDIDGLIKSLKGE